ncbi:MAG: heme-binding domain-containing protein [Kouleothrix sp.]|jgi:hypothetical protein|nr:heme-binding domain-containing protein [Kouleothrix sp.]
MRSKLIRLLFVSALVLFVVIQLVPIGPRRTNPPVQAEPPWDSPQTRALARRACFDCHSNETVWPVYAYVAPVSWFIAREVGRGRHKLNFSEWAGADVEGESEQESDEIPKVFRRGSMPPRKYLLLHPAAQLSAAEREQLLNGLLASLK